MDVELTDIVESPMAWLPASEEFQSKPIHTSRTSGSRDWVTLACGKSVPWYTIPDILLHIVPAAVRVEGFVAGTEIPSCYRYMATFKLFCVIVLQNCTFLHPFRCLKFQCNRDQLGAASYCIRDGCCRHFGLCDH
jgi:hypothetical protein